MEAFVGSLLSTGFNHGCVCERGSGATPQEPFPEVETTAAGGSCSPNINLVGFNHGKKKKKRFIRSYRGSFVPSSAQKEGPCAVGDIPK